MIVIIMMMMTMVMTVHRLEDDTEEVTVREGESLSLGCQVIAGNTILFILDFVWCWFLFEFINLCFYIFKSITLRRS